MTIDGHPRVLLVFPKFNQNSFWSFKDACEVWGARCTAPPLGLLTLAALLPQSWDLRLVNRNAEDLSDEQLDWAELILTGGMLPQQIDTLNLIDVCRRKGVPVCVGGPDISSSPHVYEEADFRVIGEAEGIIDEFVAAWERGERDGTFEAPKFQADVTKSPIPRFDLLDFKHYLFVGVQFSRGCPFTCEFCDIIELYGRVPRTKTNDQMLAELDRLLELGFRGHVDFVDDNLIGNKKAVKQFLPALKAWQVRNGYPFMFSTEASLNLADDTELLAMMREANFFAVFVGIESPDEETLVQMRKKQNTRRSIAESVHRINAAGIFVTAGFIVGFDAERASISAALLACIEATHVPIAMVGLLTALPNTQLTRRLAREGRLHVDSERLPADRGDQCTAGLNFVTLRSRRDVLVDYRNVLAQTYDPAVFFGRIRKLAHILDRPSFGTGKPTWKGIRRDLRLLGRTFWRMTVKRPELARHFWPAFIECARRNPAALQVLLMNMVVYLHIWPFSRFVIGELDRRIAEIDAGLWTEPPLVAASAPEPPRQLAAVA